MSKVRLTREQSRDQTRQRLLDAAQSIFITKGFVAASVEDIAEQAGYTRGAFYSNFGSKSELLLQLPGATMSTSWPRCAPSSSRRGLARADGRKCAAPLQHPLPRERLFRCGWKPSCRRRAIRSSASASTPVCASCAKSSPNTCGSFPSMWARRCPWRRKTGGGPLALSDGMQFSYAFDPQTITDEVTEAVLAAFFRRIVFGEPTPE